MQEKTSGQWSPEQDGREKKKNKVFSTLFWQNLFGISRLSTEVVSSICEISIDVPTHWLKSEWIRTWDTSSRSKRSLSQPLRYNGGARRYKGDCRKHQTHLEPVHHVDVSKNRGTPKSSILIGFLHYKPTILGYPYFWKHPCRFKYLITSPNPYLPFTCKISLIFDILKQLATRGKNVRINAPQLMFQTKKIQPVARFSSALYRVYDSRLRNRRFLATWDAFRRPPASFFNEGYYGAQKKLAEYNTWVAGVFLI